MEKIKCAKCGDGFEDNGFSTLCVNCRRRSHTRTYFYIAIIILILGFIGGIVLGGTYTVSKSSYFSSEEEFNGVLMLYCWVSTLLFDLFIFAIYSVCHRLDLLIDKK